MGERSSHMIGFCFGNKLDHEHSLFGFFLTKIKIQNNYFFLYFLNFHGKKTLLFVFSFEKYMVKKFNPKTIFFLYFENYIRVKIILFF